MTGLGLFDLAGVQAHAGSNVGTEANSGLETLVSGEVDPRAARDIAAGSQLASSMNRTLGVGLSPIFGLGVMGAYDYINSEEKNRIWYAYPIFFIPVLLVLVGIIAKDVFGIVLGPLKQSFDALEVMVNKAGGSLGLIATMTYSGVTMGPGMGELSMVALDTIFPAAHAAPIGAAATTNSAVALMGSFFASVLSGITYSAVWLTGQTYTIVMFLNPFSPLDPILKGARASFMGLMTGITAASPVVGVVICLIYFVAAYVVAGFCLRLSSYGAVFAWETLRRRGKGNPNDPRGILSFACKGFKGVPNRTLGYLQKKDSELLFEYRPWLLLKPRSYSVNAAMLQGLSCGAVYSSVYTKHADGTVRDVLHLPPRWVGKEPTLQTMFDIPEMRDSAIKGGIKDGIDFVRSMFYSTGVSGGLAPAHGGFAPAPIPAPVHPSPGPAASPAPVQPAPVQPAPVQSSPKPVASESARPSFCTHCGTKLSSATKFCTQCGQAV